MIYEANYLRRATLDTMERDLQDEQPALGGPVPARAGGGRRRDHRRRQHSRHRAGREPPTWPTTTPTWSPARWVSTRRRGREAFFRAAPAPATSSTCGSAVKLPARPAYYTPRHGSVDRHRPRRRLVRPALATRPASAMPQPRKKYPSFTLLLGQGGGKKLPLIKWRTTIGGWRAEQASDGYEYYRYKGSDVGERVIRQVVAGPVWVAPASTPIRSLVKPKAIGGKRQPGGQLRRARARLPVGLRPGGGLLRHPRGGGQARHRQRHPRARLGRVPVDVQPPRLFARLPPAAQPPGHPPLFVRAPPPQDAGGRRHAARARSASSSGARRSTRSASPRKGFGYVLDPPLPVEVLEGEIKGELKDPHAGVRAQARA